MLCVLSTGAIMSAIVYSIILTAMLLVSFGFLMHFFKKRPLGGFDKTVIIAAGFIFVFALGNTLAVGAYGYNTIRNNGENNAGLSLSRN